MEAYLPIVGIVAGVLVILTFRISIRLRREPDARKRRRILLVGLASMAAMISMVEAVIVVLYPGSPLDSGPSIAAVALLFIGLAGACCLAAIAAPREDES